ncbi:MAG: NADH-quinone oxidoreductase subunit NuoH [Bacteriovoracaceae bacterium]|nr:NADH-quinone oxidoreductase subunit NuoH [Bacteriovoracaceae bacterium]
MGQTVVSYLSQFAFLQNFNSWLSKLLGFDATTVTSFLVFFAAAFILLNIAAVIGGMGTYAERKISADLQARIGPNRVGPYGLFQFLADGLKMLGKEDIIVKNADRFLFTLAPLLCLVGAFTALAVIPISSGLALSHLDVGVFFLIGITSLVGLGVFLGGYSSNSKWSMLGGMRGASQIISYEIPVTITALSVCLLAGSLSFQKIIENQSGMPWDWFIFHNPFSFIAFFVFFIAALAETNRAPFDLPEAESELVSGYHTEYTGMRFAFFALAEYVEVFIVCAVASAFFLGGYKVPFNLGGDGILGQFLQIGSFFTKTFLLYYVVIWIRWTLPRLRVDQLMVLCWKYLTPIAIFNLIGIACWLYFFEGKSLVHLVVALASGGNTHH